MQQNMIFCSGDEQFLPADVDARRYSVMWDTPTQPAIYADELPACKGACRQGRDACQHPAACAGIEAPSLRTDLRRVELANGSTVAEPADELALSTGMRLVLRVAALAVVSATALAVWL